MSTFNIGEETLAAQLTQAGIDHVRQYAYAHGRKFRADFALVESRLLVEVQGGVYTRRGHGSITGVLADMKRGNVAALAGWYVLRVTPDEVEDGRALALVKRALASHALDADVKEEV